MAWYLSLEHPYSGAVDDFGWDLPADYNALHDLLRKYDDTSRTALVEATPEEIGHVPRQPRRAFRCVAEGLAARGDGRGDRVAAVLFRQMENPVVYLDSWKPRASSLPLSVFFRTGRLGVPASG